MRAIYLHLHMNRGVLQHKTHTYRPLISLEQSRSRSALWILQDHVCVHKPTTVHPPLH